LTSTFAPGTLTWTGGLAAAATPPRLKKAASASAAGRRTDRPTPSLKRSGAGNAPRYRLATLLCCN
jgi:hypothetical protein